MPRLGESSKIRLSQCAPALQTLFGDVINYFDFSVLCGHRTEPDQDQAFSEGSSKLPWPQSKHNSFPSKAIDVAPYPINFDDINRYYYFAGFVMARAIALGIRVRWGGDWDSDTQVKDEKFRDLGHFELME